MERCMFAVDASTKVACWHIRVQTATQIKAPIKLLAEDEVGAISIIARVCLANEFENCYI